MAFGRLERSRPSRPMSEINMTPLIDVMLVLLVVFILAAPLMSTSLPLELPRTPAAQVPPTAPFLALALDREGRIYLGDERTNASALAARVREAAAADPRTEVQLRADAGVPYGRVAELIGIVQEGGLSRIGFVAEREPAPAR